MAGSIIFDGKLNIIRVTFDEEAAVDDWIAGLSRVETLAKEKVTPRVLVEVRRQTYLADAGILFQFAANLPKTLAFAVLVEHHIEDHKFIESVSSNRDIKVKDFALEDEAIEWLQDVTI